MKAKLQALWEWFKAKLGRILMSAGILLQSVQLDALDITGIKGELIKLVGEGRTAAISLALFAAGFWRNQHVATKYTALLKAHQELQDAHEELKAQVAPK